ncbi:hypothetical protein FRX31_021246 [Thalictrum thalictroides]|uniref:Uncharacterized protein n=1 Tax=Thalictrum thalictroides TaxID=46969 RepID=A0A7J6UZ32_THATH|nr:hypothetical protein FRX31_032524 [Thalictrum thalictroides]KAF5189167.1 hypothetical protein FRX31_021246 [Thalictrum thalictroides]
MTGLRSGLPARDGIVHSPYVIPLPKPDLLGSSSFALLAWLRLLELEFLVKGVRRDPTVHFSVVSLASHFTPQGEVDLTSSLNYKDRPWNFQGQEGRPG